MNIEKNIFSFKLCVLANDASTLAKIICLIYLRIFCGKNLLEFSQRLLSKRRLAYFLIMLRKWQLTWFDISVATTLTA
jgi:hypothetical protein